MVLELYIKGCVLKTKLGDENYRKIEKYLHPRIYFGQKCYKASNISVLVGLSVYKKIISISDMIQYMQVSDNKSKKLDLSNINYN